MINRIKENFSLKLALTFIGFFSLSIAAITIFIVMRYSEEMHDRLRNEGRIYAVMLSGASKPWILGEKAEMLRATVDDVTGQKGVAAAGVFAADRRLLYGASGSRFQKRQIALPADLLSCNELKPYFIREDGDALDIFMPVTIKVFGDDPEGMFFSEVQKESSVTPVGYVVVSMDLKLMRNDIRDMYFRYLVFSFVFLLSGAAVILIAVRKITLPIKNLTEKALKIGEVKTPHARENRGDEIRKLEWAFEDMVAGLKIKEKTAQLAVLGEMAAGVAHEINNPNAFILSSAEVLMTVSPHIIKAVGEYEREKGQLDICGMSFDEIKGNIPELLKGIHEGAQRIACIVANMKALARQDPSMSGQAQIDPVNVCRTALPFLKEIISRHTDKFSFTAEDNLPPIIGNAGKIEQAFINLVINALQALPDRGRGVYVSVSCPAPGEVLLEVKDEGVGIPKDRLEHIFMPFYTTKDDGTGLGLSIASTIAKEHNAILEASSDPGVGTTMRIRFHAVKRETA